MNHRRIVSNPAALLLLTAVSAVSRACLSIPRISVPSGSRPCRNVVVVSHTQHSRQAEDVLAVWERVRH